MVDSLPKKIGKYEILEHLGSGAMGVVYKGMDPRLQRPVAIKTLSAELVGNDKQRARFYHEATATARLTHPNIVSIFDLDEIDGVPYIVMEFVDGLNLQNLIESRVSFPIPQVVLLLAQAAEGLHHAHEQGVIHRDIKPSNLILSQAGVVKIVDFGIAQMLESELVTRTGIIVGTPAYMSPEQASGDKVDARTDQYSLGVIAYELFTGSNPFRAETLTAVLLKILQHIPDRKVLLDTGCPKAICNMIFQSIEKDREKRFPRMTDIAQGCRRVLEDTDSLEQLDTCLMTATLPAVARETGQDGGAEELSRWQQEGVRLAGEGRYEEASEYFARVLERDPARLEAIQWRQKIARWKKEKLYRETIRPLLEEAESRAEKKEYLESNRLYQKVLELDPEYDEVLAAMEKNHRNFTDSEKASWLLSRALEAAHQGKFAEAFENYSEMVRLFPGTNQLPVLRREIWSAFHREVAGRLEKTDQRSEIRESLQWLEHQLAQKPVIAFLCGAGNTAEKNSWLAMLQSVTRRWGEQRKSAYLRQLLLLLQPLFPAHPVISAMEEQLQSAHQDLLRDTAWRHKKQRLMAEIQNSLQQGEYAIALIQALRLSQEHPQDESILKLLETIRGCLASSHAPPGDPAQREAPPAPPEASRPAAKAEEKPVEPVAGGPGDSARQEIAERVKIISDRFDFPFIAAPLRDRILKLAAEDRPVAQLSLEVQKDFGLTLKLLKKICSLPRSRFRNQSIAISQAITLLGSGAVQEAAAGMDTLESHPDLIDLREVMLLSLLTAFHCRETASRLPGLDPEEMFLFGMVRNIGELAVNAYFPGDYTRFLWHLHQNFSTEQEAALAVLGFTFEQLAQKLIEGWNFPAEMKACFSNPLLSRKEKGETSLRLLSHLVNFGHQLTQIVYRQPKRKVQNGLSFLQSCYGNSLQLKQDDIIAILQSSLGLLRPTLSSLKLTSEDLRLDRQISLRWKEG